MMTLKFQMIKFSRILKKKNISEPFNSLSFILLKIHGYDLINFRYFKKTIYPKISRLKMRKFIYNNFLHFILKRMNHYPIQYMLGKWYFRNIIVECKPPVLIPRIETELIIDLSLNNIFDLVKKRKISNSSKKIPNENSLKFLEIGVGTGAIFISIIKEISEKNYDKILKYSINSIECVGVDIDYKCIELSNINAKKILTQNLNFTNYNINLINCDFNEFTLAQSSDKFDFIISNPPYIKSTADNVMIDVSKHESHLALYSGEDGLDLIRKIIVKSRDLIKQGGFVILEIDPEQCSKLIDILLLHKFRNFYFEKDLFERERFLIYFIN